MRVGKLAAVVGVTACALGAGSAAMAASTAPQGGKIHVFVTQTSETKGKILVTGAIGDYGTTVSQDANGKVDPNGAFQKVTLKQGSFIDDGTGLTNKLNHAKPVINKANCSFLVSATAPTTIEDGTGAYAGITGKVAITVTFAFIVPQTPKGCNFGSNAKVSAGYQSITGTGSVSFP